MISCHVRVCRLVAIACDEGFESGGLYRSSLKNLILREPMAHGDIDQEASARALRVYALPACCHIPIAARNEAALEKYVGHIARVLTPGSPNKALLVHRYDAPPLNRRLPIWALKESAILHRSQQVWVHVDHRGYREAYARAFLDESLNELVLDHILNRKMARAMRFDYLRIVPISRGANSSSGGLPEKWGVAYQSSPAMLRINARRQSFIQYADLGDIVKMLNLKTGGALQDAVNEALSLVQEPTILTGSDAR